MPTVPARAGIPRARRDLHLSRTRPPRRRPWAKVRCETANYTRPGPRTLSAFRLGSVYRAPPTWDIRGARRGCTTTDAAAPWRGNNSCSSTNLAPPWRGPTRTCASDAHDYHAPPPPARAMTHYMLAADASPHLHGATSRRRRGVDERLFRFRSFAFAFRFRFLSTTFFASGTLLRYKYVASLASAAGVAVPYKTLRMS